MQIIELSIGNYKIFDNFENEIKLNQLRIGKELINNIFKSAGSIQHIDRRNMTLEDMTKLVDFIKEDSTDIKLFALITLNEDEKNFSIDTYNDRIKIFSEDITISDYNKLYDKTTGFFSFLLTSLRKNSIISLIDNLNPDTAELSVSIRNS